MTYLSAVWLEKHGRWQINVTSSGKRKSFYSSIPGKAGKREAEERAAAWLRAGTPGQETVEDAWALFLQREARMTGSGNVANMESFGRAYILPAVGHCRLSSVRVRDWQRILDDAASRGLSRKTLNNIRAAIRKFQKWCDGNDLNVRTGPLEVARSAPPSRRTVATPDQIRTLFSKDTVIKRGHEGHEWWIHAFRFILACGLRRGECAGIMETDIEENVLVIRRSINPAGEVTEGKTVNAQRRIALSSLAMQIIEDQRAQKRASHIVSPWLFCSQKGEAMDTCALQREWHRFFASQSGITCGLHELRHTFISIVKSDMPLALLRSQVGHSAGTDSIGIYGHEYDGDLPRSREIVEQAFSRLRVTK